MFDKTFLSEKANTSYDSVMAFQRLVRKLTKENLWLYILSLLKEGPLYGYEVEKMIEKRFGFRPGKVTCYVVIYMLQKEGLIAVSQTIPSDAGPPRTYYKITKKGEELLEKAKEFLDNLRAQLFAKEKD
ncbi:MAG: PadR family transcriptional regulator [Thaumarchaeota archaeon]|jgi:DNA-binding PadR family transcriptional regulator|nr:PadR family transcriptional regulator [Candidatus Terraquivivens yellowstonensis]MCL7398719.1 PadR family transcriptional regulator [Candidatus Terraquivivens yellowstonensis]